LADYLDKTDYPGMDKDVLGRAASDPNGFRIKYGANVLAPYSSVIEFLKDFRPLEKKLNRMRKSAKKSRDVRAKAWH
jgi:hypothetical protein